MHYMVKVEDGKINHILNFSKKYTHSGVLSSIIAMNKHFSSNYLLKIFELRIIYFDKLDLNISYLKRNFKMTKFQ